LPRAAKERFILGSSQSKKLSLSRASSAKVATGPSKKGAWKPEDVAMRDEEQLGLLAYLMVKTCVNQLMQFELK